MYAELLRKGGTQGLYYCNGGPGIRPAPRLHERRCLAWLAVANRPVTQCLHRADLARQSKVPLPPVREIPALRL